MEAIERPHDLIPPTPPSPFQAMANMMIDQEFVNKLSRRSDPDLQDKNGNTALMLAMRVPFVKRSMYEGAVNTMISRSRSLDLQNNDGRTALMDASWGQNTDVVQTLIDKGANVDIQDQNGRTAVMDFVFTSRFIGAARLPTLNLMLSRSNLDLKAADGSTVLMQAAQRNDAEVVRALNAHGADLNISDNNGRTALMYAARSGNLDAVRALLDLDGHGATNGIPRKADPYMTSGPQRMTALKLAEDALRTPGLPSPLQDNLKEIVAILRKEMQLD